MCDLECIACNYANIKTKKLLPCLHTICESCLSSLISSNNEILQCPKCSLKIKIPKAGCNGFKSITLNVDGSASEDNISESVCACLTDVIESATTLQQGNPKQIIQPAPNLNEVIITDKNVEVDNTETKEKSENGEHGRKIEDKQYCCNCDLIICSSCCIEKHEKHSVLPIGIFTKLKKDFICEMVNTLQKHSEKTDELASVIEYLSLDLTNSLESIKSDIVTRADELCEVITKKKDVLLKSIESIIDTQRQYYQDFQKAMCESVEVVRESVEFTQKVIKEEAELNLLQFHNEISSRLSHLVQQTKESLKILNVKLDTPDKGKTEVFADKLYGSLIQGDTVCGDANLLATFKTDLNWPCGVVVSKSNEYMLCGKSGAFEHEGRLVCYDKHGKSTFSYTLPNRSIPNGICLLPNNDICISTSDGNIFHLTSDGIPGSRWESCAKGSNNIAQYSGEIYVTSCDECCIKVFDTTGKQLKIFYPTALESQSKLKPSLIDISHNGSIAITSFQENSIYFLDENGIVISEYSDATNIQCPTAIQFDVFGNLLVADFTADCIHLLSQSGRYLGKLLDKSHKIACPNAIAFDNEGHLLIGQYGGDISVFGYRSISKQT